MLILFKLISEYNRPVYYNEVVFPLCQALTLYPPNYLIGIFTHLKLCLAGAIHNFKWVKIIRIWQNESQLFSNISDLCHILSLTCLYGGT